MSSIENARPLFPSFDDYKGAMTAIFRLQDTYHLGAESLSDGIVPGARKSAALSINDMFELGRHAYDIKDWFHTRGWMEACLKKMGADASKDGITRFDVLDHLAFTEYHVSTQFLDHKHSASLGPKVCNQEVYTVSQQNFLEWLQGNPFAFKEIFPLNPQKPLFR